MNLAFSAPEAEIPMSSYVSGVTGFSPYARTVEPVFKPGNLQVAPDGTIWEYGRATAAVTVTAPTLPAASTGLMMPYTPPTGAACAYAPATGLVSAGAGYTAFASFAIGEHGWVKRDGTGI
jgi:hypothetical protein